ncbi:pheromone A receptor-domain-containing protein [Pisolithus orientalis]|uniref:pheromone A receptor-domain-containing protein n=1 Tax=Pisolithus orientalis TaxID=936130 RepID=UPI002224C39A|nr:pheromone A receptor-domain-containing protein [Pisolithus orientalis]KAI6002478.1 pheromone A receptor-domain-containing protein [Pisolithus orientalis]
MPVLQVLLSAFSFFLSALVLTPLTCYFRASNIAAMAVGGWLSVVNVIYAVPLWCDISSSFITASHFALPAAYLCICIHLERLASFSQTSAFVSKRQRILLECIICFALPFVYTAIHLLVQPRRFDLYEGFGFWVPPIFLAIGASAAWWHFLVHGVQFSRGSGGSSASSLTRNMYIRLVGMAVTQVLLSTSADTLGMWYTLSPGLLPISKISRDFDEVLIWHSGAITETVGTVLLVEWIGVMVQSALFFGLFAFRKDFIKDCVDRMRAIPETIRRWVLRMRGQGKMGHRFLMGSSVCTSAPVLPVTILDFTMAIAKPSTETQLGHSVVEVEKSSLSELTLQMTVVVVVDSAELLDPTLLPLKSPSIFSTIPSSHNSLDSGFDPHQVVFPHLEDWPKPPVTTSAAPRSRKALSMTCMSKGNEIEEMCIPAEQLTDSRNENC